MSMTIMPGRRRWPRPLSTTTARTASASASMVTTMSASASAAGSVATSAPSAASGSLRFGLRFQTMSGKPPAWMFRAIGSPMRPRPAKPTFNVDSDEDLAAIDHVHLPGHVVGLGRGEVDEEGRELLGRSRSPDESARRKLTHRIRVARLLVDRADVLVQADPHGCVHDTGR